MALTGFGEATQQMTARVPTNLLDLLSVRSMSAAGTKTRAEVNRSGGQRSGGGLPSE